MSETFRRLTIESVIDKISRPVVYGPEKYGITSIPYTGKNVKISILDSGVPTHKSIKKPNEYINFTKDKVEDSIGHSTMISGLIGASDNKGVTGLATNAELYHVKLTEGSSIEKANTIIAGIVWSVIKKVDIILMPFVTNVEENSLSVAIQKAADSNICMIAPVGNDKNINYPAKHNSVLSVGSLDSNNKLSSFSARGDFNIIGVNVLTTFKDNKFAIASGTSVSSATAAGICARIIEKMKLENIKFKPSDIYSIMKSLSPINDDKISL